VDIELMKIKLDFKDIDTVAHILFKNQVSMEQLSPEVCYYVPKPQAEEKPKKQEQGIIEEIDTVSKGAHALSETHLETCAKQHPFKTTVSNTQCSIKSIVVSFNDGDYDHFLGQNTTLPIPLMEISLCDLSLSTR
jgi:hypothetical protein